MAAVKAMAVVELTEPEAFTAADSMTGLLVDFTGDLLESPMAGFTPVDFTLTDFLTANFTDTDFTPSGFIIMASAAA